jgi:hypothetical protein
VRLLSRFYRCLLSSRLLLYLLSLRTFALRELVLLLLFCLSTLLLLIFFSVGYFLILPVLLASTVSLLWLLVSLS